MSNYDPVMDDPMPVRQHYLALKRPVPGLR